MIDKVLSRYAKPHSELEVTPATEPDMPDDLGAFGWLRGVRDRAIMLELRHKDGRVTALGYAWLERADFDPSEGITLRFTGQTTVRIAGSNLNAESRPTVRLFSGIVRHRVPWIQEAGGADAMEAPSGKTVVEVIKLG
jgi:hypothetical protein